MKIVITGSLGHIGKPLTTALVKQGHAVTVISSSAGKQKDIEAIGATAAIGSLDDVTFLTSVFKGADAAFVMVPPKFDEPDVIAYYSRLGGNYVQAIQKTGIKHIVALSSYGAHLDKGTGFILGAHNLENVLNELQDVAITYLRPGYFYYNLYNFTDMIKGTGMMGSNYGGDDQLPMVAPADIAVAAAEALTTAASGNKVRYIVSDERSCNEVAHVLGAAIGKPGLQWLTFTDEQAKAGMEQSGLPEHIAKSFVELGAGIHNGILRQDYDQHKPKEMGGTKIEAFAAEFANAF